MIYNIVKPSAILEPYVKCYWLMENCVCGKENYTQRVVPNGFTELIFYYSGAPEYKREKSSVKSSAVINGQQDTFYDISIGGDLKLLSIIFKPQAARLIFGIPHDEFYNQNVPAQFIFKSEIRDIVDKLNYCSSDFQKVKIIEKFLFNKLVQNRDFEVKRVTNSIDIINTSKGIERIDSLAEKAYLSKKQFERTFRDIIGISPKKFLKIVRFQYAVYKQQISKGDSLTSLAYNTGYYDQSHMINDFKKLSGLTPTQYFAECDPFSDYFAL